MRLHRLLLPFISLTLALSITFLTGCGKSKEAAPGAGPTPSAVPSASSDNTPLPSGFPFLIMTQTPEMARPGQFVQHPRGLVAAMWNDGRIIRCVNPSTVGKSYVTGTVDAKEREALLEYLKSNDVKSAPKPPHLRLHTATLVATTRTGDGKEKWITELPNDDSVWVRLQGRLLSVPLTDSRPADPTIVRSVSLED